MYYYTLYKLIRNNIAKLNRHVVELTNRVLNMFESEIDILKIIENGYEFIEKNENLLRYSDLTLYEHQKDIFVASKKSNPKLHTFELHRKRKNALYYNAFSVQRAPFFDY